MATSEPCVGRLAPSPTGPLHVGHARTFLLAWWSARSQGGRVILRMEDLDAARCRPEFAEWVLEDLRWLGLDWDDYVTQSERAAIIAGFAHRLLGAGEAFACVCSRGDVREALAAPHGPPAVGYPGTCRGRFAPVAEAVAKTGKQASIRFRGRHQLTGPLDAFTHSLLVSDPEDFIILRRDGTPAYHLAVVVDDAACGVTEVVRGDDLLLSTPLHLQLYRALCWPFPAYYHVPLVCDAQGRRLAKREASLSLRQLREQGVRAEEVVRWVAQSAGLTPKPSGLARAYASEFSFAAVSRAPQQVPAGWLR